MTATFVVPLWAVWVGIVSLIAALLWLTWELLEPSTRGGKS